MATALARGGRGGDLVGRERECAVWAAMLDALPGKGAALVVSGEPGIGKSCLQRRFVTIASGLGVKVLRVSCRAAGTGSAYRPLIEALAPLTRPGGPLAGDVPAAYRSAVRTVNALWESDRAPDAEDGSLALAESVMRVLSLLAGERGLVLAVEDVQWADPDTYTILEHVARTVDSAPILLSITARTDPTGRAAVARITDTDAATELSLDRLDATASAELIAGMLDRDVPAEVVDFVSVRAEGLPLAIEELTSDLLRTGALSRDGGAWVVYETRLRQAYAPSIEAAVKSRLGRLDPDSVAVAVAVALRDSESTWDQIAEITGQQSDVAAASLQVLASTDLLVTAGRGRYRYRHGLIRDAVLAGAPPSVVRALAGRAATELARQADSDAAGLAEVAALWDRAGDADAASRAHAAAAWRWLARGAAATAEINARAAVELAVSAPVRAEAYDAVTEALTRMGRFGDALPHLEQALGDGSGLACARTAQMHCRAARCALETGDAAGAARHLHLAQRAGGAAHEVYALRATLAFEARDARAAAGFVERAVALAEATGDPLAHGSALLVQARVLRANDPYDAQAGLERLVALATAHGLPALHERAVLELGLVDRLTTNRVDRLMEAHRLAVERGSLHTQAVAEVNMWPVLAERGDLDGAQRICRHSVEMSQRYRLRTALPAATMAVLLDAMCGRFEAAATRVDQLGQTVFGGGAAMYLELFRGEPADALAAIAPSAEAINNAPDARPSPARGLYALLTAVLHDDPAPSALVGAAGIGAWYNRGLVRLAEAVIAGSRGDRAGADRLAAEGQCDLAPFPSLAALAATLVGPSAIADRWGDPAAWLGPAREHFQWLGNDVMRRRCEAQLRAGGLPVPRHGRGNADVPQPLRRLGVTSREMDVLLLVAQHLTNAQIAERLFLSPRTVDTHVSRLIAKAGVAGRAGLAALVDPRA